MGYFSNGTEGDIYEATFCQRCVHDDPNAGLFCPVLGLHQAWDYSQCDKTPVGRAQKEALDSLIPRKGIHNLACLMFTPRSEDDRHVAHRWNERVKAALLEAAAAAPRRGEGRE